MEIEIINSCTDSVIEIDWKDITEIPDRELEDVAKDLLYAILKENKPAIVIRELVEYFGDTNVSVECELCGNSYNNYFNTNK